MQLPNTQFSERLFLWLAVAAAIFAIFMHIGIVKTNISREEWAKSADYIRKHFQKGDVISLLPTWALKGAEPLRDLPIMYSEQIASEDLRRYRRLWVMVAPRLGRWWFKRTFQDQISALGTLYWQREAHNFAKIEVYLFQLPPPIPLVYDFSDSANLSKAEVWLDAPPRIAGCPTNALGAVQKLQRWLPHPGWWQGEKNYFFGRVIQEVGDSPRDCLWAQTLRCRVLHVRYRNVPWRGVLHIAHGFGTATPSKISPSIPPSGPNVKLEIWAENQFAGNFLLSQNQRWQKHEIQLNDLPLELPKALSPATNTTHTTSVEFRISVPHLQGERPGYCFHAELRDN